MKSIPNIIAMIAVAGVIFAGAVMYVGAAGLGLSQQTSSSATTSFYLDIGCKGSATDCPSTPPPNCAPASKFVGKPGHK